MQADFNEKSILGITVTNVNLVFSVKSLQHKKIKEDFPRKLVLLHAAKSAYSIARKPSPSNEDKIIGSEFKIETPKAELD